MLRGAKGCGSSGGRVARKGYSRSWDWKQIFLQRMGRLVAIRSACGGFCGLLATCCGGLLPAPWLSLAQQFSQQPDGACHPHSYASSTHAGAEALVHILEAEARDDRAVQVLMRHCQRQPSGTCPMSSALCPCLPLSDAAQRPDLLTPPTKGVGRHSMPACHCDPSISVVAAFEHVSLISARHDA